MSNDIRKYSACFNYEITINYSGGIYGILKNTKIEKENIV